MSIAADTYLRWRASLRRDHHFDLQDAGTHAPPPEHAMQMVWLHQRILRDRLRTLDGRRLQVLHPGFPNRSAGPDFRDAVLRFGNDPARTVDVEIDREASGWRQHHHAGNPDYQEVALHVVWDTPPASHDPTPLKEPPLLAMCDVLDAPLDEILDALPMGPTEQAPAQPGACAPFLVKLREKAGTLADLIGQAALLRLAQKAAVCTAAAHTKGWRQALWETLFSTLGYRPNVWPMRRVAECLSDLFPTTVTQPGQVNPVSDSEAASVEAWQARLLGMAGLLPHELTRTRASTDNYLRRLWDHWWRVRDAASHLQLPSGVWSIRGLRPANHPARRLALAAHWLARSDWVDALEAWADTDLPPEKAAPSLFALLEPSPDPFWDVHLTLRSPASRASPTLLGQDKAADLAINAILPWFHARAHNNPALRSRIEARYFAWPASADNQALKTVRARLFGGAKPLLPNTAAMQQGQLQILRDFCDHSNALCEGCAFPDLARSLRM